MDVNSNTSSIKLEGHVQVERYRYLYFTVMLLVYALILCSNFMLVFLIGFEKSLHEPMYVFIAALSLNSVFFSTAIYPKLLTDFVSEEQIISYTACRVQYFMFYSLGGSEFLLLAAMAYDRYVSICKPLQYPAVMRKATVSALLLLAWLLPAGQVAVLPIVYVNSRLCSFALKGIFCNNSTKYLYCVSPRALSIYAAVILVNIVVFPILFIFFTYAKIFVIARQNSEVRRKATQTCLPHLFVLISFSCFCAYDVIAASLESDFPKIVRLIMTLQIITYQPLLNPIIYGLKMKEISKRLKKLLCRVKHS
ncbi:olfactory receptor 6N2-like [Salarias fasciatus]|uniref:Olfactory receptor n=1 Tax=Salarias fasciatus TaxID=181472 RepID=A0A672H3I3_SALFA|nr:olfactory receptor 6N2-like [Salarias fasciatus]